MKVNGLLAPVSNLNGGGIQISDHYRDLVVACHRDPPGSAACKSLSRKRLSSSTVVGRFTTASSAIQLTRRAMTGLSSMRTVTSFLSSKEEVTLIACSCLIRQSA